MQLFDENTDRLCCCNKALKKGIFTKSISNNSFCVYGNLMQGKSVLLNYSGKLINDKNIELNNKKSAPNVYLYYCFDNNWNDKKIVNMSVCAQNSNLSYCTIIDIPDCSSLHLAFTDDNDLWDTDSKGTYFLNIYEDVEKSIIRRYGLDSTPPTIVSDKLPGFKSDMFPKLKAKLINIFSLFSPKPHNAKKC